MPMVTTLSLLRFAPLPPRLTRSSLAINHTSSQYRSVGIHPRVPPISASYTIPTIDRAISLVAYIHPFVNSLRYGRLLQSLYPLIASLTSPFMLILTSYQRDPLVDLLVFIILCLVEINPKFSPYVRFNARQAVKLDVMLTWPYLVHFLVRTPTSRIGVKVLECCNGAIFVLGCVTFVYTVLCCVVGCTPHLPFASSVTDKQL